MLTEPIKRDIAKVTMIIESDNGQTHTMLLDGRAVDIEVLLAEFGTEGPSPINLLEQPSRMASWDKRTRAVSCEVRARRRLDPRNIAGLSAYDGEPGRLATFSLWPVVGSRVMVPVHYKPWPHGLVDEPGEVREIRADGVALVDHEVSGSVQCPVRELRRFEEAGR